MGENMLCFLIFTLFIPGYFSFSFNEVNETEDWGYDKTNGPSTWAKAYPICGSGQKQSPIDILTKDAKRKVSLSPMHLWEYDQDLKDVKIVNDGHTVRLSANNSKAKIAGGCMHETEYKFWQMHFHWGNVEDRGSEHQIDGKSFPMEAHLVHYNTKYTLEEASTKPDGLAVVAFFLEASKKNNPNFDSIVETVNTLESNHDHSIVKGTVNLRQLLPRDRTFYYCYQGSLTTPACNEIVTWSIFGSTAEISEEQLEAFRGLKNQNQKRLSDNYRPVQKLYKRAVYVKGGAELISAPAWLISIVVIALISRVT